MKDVSLNGITYPGVSTINLATPDGGTAKFRDVDEAAAAPAPAETQTVKCNPELAENYGGVSIKFNPGEQAIYAGYPDSAPGAGLIADRFPSAIIVNVRTDNTVGVAAVGYSGTNGFQLNATVSGDTINIIGGSAGYLINALVEFTFHRIPVEVA